MFDHKRYQELSALAMIGQLSSVEDDELNEHLIGCSICQQIYEDYSRIAHKLIRLERGQWRAQSAIQPPLLDPELRNRFIVRARAEGINLSSQVEGLRPAPSTSFQLKRRYVTALACAVLGTAAFWVASTVYPNYLSQHSQLHSSVSVGAHASGGTSDTETSRLRKLVSQQTGEVAHLHQEETSYSRIATDLREELAELKRQEAVSLTELQQSRDETERLNITVQQKNAAIADLTAKNEDMNKRQIDNLSRLAIQETRIESLMHSLLEERDNVERDQQLMAVTQDIRQLMGARKLHIIDVHDVNASSGSDRAFGRVFYAEGQAMIFYAFDLPSGDLSPAKYMFKAWGQREDGTQSLRNLGTFEVDSVEQHRWVLKVNDPRLVSGIDSVFVTAESLKDGKEPRGKKLLYAFLGGEPNHP